MGQRQHAAAASSSTMSASVFSAVPVDATGRGKQVLAACWCSAKEPALLAVAVQGGSVLVLEEDGTLHDEDVRNKPSNDVDARVGGSKCEAACFAWTSAVLQGSVLLAVGWTDGTR